jgi:hypothetical protein
MANSTVNILLDGIGQEGRRFPVGVAASTAIKAGTYVSQLVSNGMLVPASTAGAGPVIGKATHEANNSGGAAGAIECLVETERVYRTTNGATTDACSASTPLFSPVYALDDNTCADNDNSGTLQKMGLFFGMEPDGKVRVGVFPPAVQSAPVVQAGRGTFAAGVRTINAGITVTATSRVFASRVTEAGTDGDEIRVPDADRTAGGPGTGALVFRSFLSGVAATSDTSTFDYIIVG